ncbi:MAG: DinB family protein [Microbacteriaceae bacterium]|nr:MAG: DinB family protein [Microbacteriaceae bacterium]
MPIVPETKSWTWVLDKPCPECGFDASSVAYASIPVIVRDNATQWPAVLARADVRLRPNDHTWSPLEYAAHVRDVHRVFLARVELMRREDDPVFTNWDQDAAAVADRYDLQDPAAVARELTDAAGLVAAAFQAVPVAELGRTARRSDGATFTIATLARYFVHDPVHHLWDVTHTV